MPQPLIAVRSVPTGSGRAERYTGAFRQFMVISAIAFWLGGFTFYASVAIPMAHEVLGTHRKVGFITERVTNWLNVAGVAALAILLWNTVASRKHSGGWVWRGLIVTWILMAAIQIGLIALHPAMDRLIGMTTPTPGAPPIRTLLDQARFDSIHRIYLTSTTAQWFLGLLHVWCVCLSWAPRNANSNLGPFPNPV